MSVKSRYQIIHPGVGLVAWASRFDDAVALGDRYATSPRCGDPYLIEIFDRLARRGNPEAWRRTPSGWRVVSCRP